MTLQQLKYVTAVADRGSINEAARQLYVSQPSLSAAIRELETEIRTVLFLRTSRGVRLTAEGEEFLRYARQVLSQAELLEERYSGSAPVRRQFSVSTHHYLFAANAFVALAAEAGGDAYAFTLRETTTYEIIDDVKTLRSELGLLYLSPFNEPVIRKLLRDSDLLFTPLFTVRPHVFLSRAHPLAGRASVTPEELSPYPCVSFDQGVHNSFFLSEEILSTRSVKKSIRVTDRAASVNCILGLSGYTLSTGVFPEHLHGDQIVSVPLDAEETICVGFILPCERTLSPLGARYVDALRQIADGIPNRLA